MFLIVIIIIRVGLCHLREHKFRYSFKNYLIQICSCGLDIDSNFLLHGAIFIDERHISANIYLFKVNHRNTRKRCEICSKLTMKTLERRPAVCIVNFERISHLFLVFL